MKLSVYCMLIILFTSCGNSNEDTVKSKVDISKVDLEGYWGNTIYVDEVLNKGYIQSQVLCTIIWTSVVFEIKNDTLIRIGHKGDFDTLLISKNIDNLATMDGFGTYKLSYNYKADLLQTTTLDYKKSESICTEITSFRRLTKEEGKKVQESLKK